jgi:hypothetical protein
MATQKTWSRYRNEGLVGADSDVLSMLKDTTTTIRSLEKMHGVDAARIVVASLLNDYLDLKTIAQARHLPLASIPRLGTNE